MWLLGVISKSDLNDFRMEEEFFEDGDQKENVENIIQKLNVSKSNKEYKIFTSNFDEIEKAENLEKDDEIKKLRNNLDHQLTNFQDVITKLAIEEDKIELEQQKMLFDSAKKQTEIEQKEDSEALKLIKVINK